MPRMTDAAAAVASFALWAAAGQAAAADFDIDKVVHAIRAPKPDLVLLSAHGGLWRAAPPNSVQAIDAAVKAGLESVEVDVRLSGSGTPWLLQDQVLDRLTTRTGYLSAWRDDAIRLLVLADGRKSGGARLDTFEDALDYYAAKMTVADGRLGGFVLVADLKRAGEADPNAAKVSAYEALKASCGVLAAKARATGKPLGRGVIFKLDGGELPAPGDLEADLTAAGCFDDLRLMIVLPLEPEAARALREYYDKPYAVAFAPLITSVGQEPLASWIRQLQADGRSVPGLVAGNEYPEGAAGPDGLCCASRNTDPGQGRPDYSGSFLFHLQVGANWLTADDAPFLDDYLAARGQRDLDRIR